VDATPPQVGAVGARAVGLVGADLVGPGPGTSRADAGHVDEAKHSLELWGVAPLTSGDDQRERFLSLFDRQMNLRRQASPGAAKPVVGRFNVYAARLLPLPISPFARPGGVHKIRWSELFPVLRRYGLSVERTVEVLDDLGLFDDDRVPPFESWLERKLADLTPGIRADVEHWLRTLRGGGPRSRARSHNTPWAYLLQIHSVLLAWSDRYDHLREVTRDDIGAIADSCQGAQRHHTLSALRSLFRHCKKNGTVFKDPAARIRIGEKPRRILLPLQPAQIEQAVQAATTPADRLVLALAAIHAARPKAIRELRLDDVDLGNRWITIAGKARPLDDLTRDMVIDWLEYRRSRWPNTANLHLIINQQTAMETGPVRGVHMTDAFRGQAATLDRLRMHRQLDEALHVGPDPLHLAAVFGLDPKTAIRYAENARLLLETAAERQAAHDSPAENKSTNGPHAS
jgi:site-specific recombinase XerC